MLKARLNSFCHWSQSFTFILSFPPYSLILNIVSGIPYDVINALNPGIVPFELSKYGKLWYILLYKDLFTSPWGKISLEADIKLSTYSKPVGVGKEPVILG